MARGVNGSKGVAVLVSQSRFGGGGASRFLQCLLVLKRGIINEERRVCCSVLLCHSYITGRSNCSVV